MTEKFFNINANGCSVRSKIYLEDKKSVSKVVLYGHGFGGHKDNKAAKRFAEFVLKKHRDVAVITFDAPCHGDDVKKKLTDMKDFDTYIKTVNDYAAQQFHTDKIYVYATSFGGYQFLRYISEHGCIYKKIALRCPAVNMYDVLSLRIMSDEEQKALSKNKPVSVGFDRKINITRQFMEALREADISVRDFTEYAGDILILHGTKDEVVSFDFVKAFAEKNGIRFIPVENADHRFKNPLNMDFAIKEIADFFDFE